MHALTQIVLGLSATVIAGSMVVLVLEMKNVRRAVETQRHRGTHFTAAASSVLTSSGLYGAAHTGFGIYVYRDNRWHLEADLSAPGCEVTAPTMKGSFSGQVVKREATLRR